MQTSYPHNKSVEQGLKIIELLSEQGGLTDKQIAECLNFRLSMIRKLLSIYVDAGYIVCHDNTYDLSVKIIDISRKFKQRREIKEIAKTHLRMLSEKYNETVTIGAMEGGNIINIDSVDSLQLLKFSPQSEQRIPAHLSALGKAILSQLPQRDLDKYCQSAQWKAYTPKSIDTRQKLLIRLQQVRRQGFSICDEEYSMGLRSIAVAILDSFNYPRMAIGIWGPTTRLVPSILRQMRTDLMDASLEVSKYFTASFKTESKLTFDSNVIQLPTLKRPRPKKSFLERTAALFL